MEIQDYRDALDKVDEELVKLFCKRMELCGGIAQWKQAHGRPIYDRSREREKLMQVSALADERFSAYTRCLYRSLLGYSRAYQHELLDAPSELAGRIHAARQATPELFPTHATVACQGVEGAYSSLACEKLFAEPDIRFCPTFEDVFSAVDRGDCRYGVLPIENSTAGSVRTNYDLLVKYQCYIVRSTRLLVGHSLLAKAGTKLSDVRVVYSHEQALEQCAKYLAGLPNIEIRPCANTALAAKQVAESDEPGAAALSSRHCAELYGLRVLAENVQDAGANRTRFLCISRQPEIYPGANRTTLLLVLKHRPGALFAVLERCNELGVNLVKLESRPIPERDFEVQFYFDLDIAAASPTLTRLIPALEAEAEELKYLGSYSEIV